MPVEQRGDRFWDKNRRVIVMYNPNESDNGSVFDSDRPGDIDPGDYFWSDRLWEENR